MKVEKTNLEGVLVIVPRKYEDKRGFFYESYQENRYFENGIKYNFVQDNHSRSTKDVLRGLHYQIDKPQGKLVRCTKGCVFDVVVDINKKSKTYGEHFSIYLDDISCNQLWVPPGYAHGFCVISDQADFVYKCTEYYYPNLERGVIWNDKFLDIQWPIKKPIVSEKDQSFKTLAEL